MLLADEDYLSRNRAKLSKICMNATNLKPEKVKVQASLALIQKLQWLSNQKDAIEVFALRVDASGVAASRWKAKEAGSQQFIE